MAARLVEARLLDGRYDSAYAAARAMGLPEGTYSGHENGNRGFDKDDALRYANFYKVNILWLLYAIGNPRDKIMDQRILALPPERRKAVDEFLSFQEGLSSQQ